MTSSRQSAAFVDRYAAAFEQATKAFGSAAQAERWMFEPAFGLQGRRPIDLLRSAKGARQVRTLLGQIEYGVYP